MPVNIFLKSVGDGARVGITFSTTAHLDDCTSDQAAQVQQLMLAESMRHCEFWNSEPIIIGAFKEREFRLAM